MGEVPRTLFKLHLHVKQNDVNSQRNAEEVRRHREIIEKQINDLQRSSYASLFPIWHYTSNHSHPISKEDILITDEPSQSISPKSSEDFTHWLENFQTKLPGIITLANPNSSDRLTLDSALLILSHFRFLWSAEQIDSFAQFVGQLSPALQLQAYFCYLLHPLTLMYFRNVLSAVFRRFSSATNEAILEFLKERLLLYAPLFPPFLRTIVAGRAAVFWSNLLRPAFGCPAVFGFAHPELLMESERQISQIEGTFANFFNSEDGQKFVDTIATFPESLAVLPSQKLLFKVHPAFSNAILWDGRCADRLKVQRPTLPGGLLLIPVAAQGEASQARPSDSPPICQAVRRFLILARLVKIEGSGKFTKTIDFFRRLKALSSVDGNAEIEAAFQAVSECLEREDPGLPAVCEIVERELSAEENDGGSGILACISEYSFQKIYLTRLKEVVDAIPKNALNLWEFTEIAKFVQGLMSDPSLQVPTAGQIIADPSLLAALYRTCAEKMVTAIQFSARPTFATYRNLYSVLLSQLNVMETFYSTRTDLQTRDVQIHDFVEANRATLLAGQNQRYREIFERGEDKVQMFFDEVKTAFAVRQPFQRMAGIHFAFEVLTGILHLIGEKEVGADQIVPFALIGIVFTNPIGLASTDAFLKEFIEPITGDCSPLDHAVEYSRVQFMGTYDVIALAYEKSLNQGP
jgi:hypothetical protein